MVQDLFGAREPDLEDEGLILRLDQLDGFRLGGIKEVSLCISSHLLFRRVTCVGCTWSLEVEIV